MNNLKPIVPISGGNVVMTPFIWMMKNVINPPSYYLGETPPYSDAVVEEMQEFNREVIYYKDDSGVHLRYQSNFVEAGAIKEKVLENLFVGGKLVKEELDLTSLDPYFVAFYYQPILQFAGACAQENPYLVKAMKESEVPYKAGGNNKSIINLYELSIRYQGLFESYLKTNSRLLVSSLSSDIDFKKSVKDTFGIPQKAIAILEKIGMTKAIVDLGQLKEIGVDGNDIIAVAEFLHNTRKIQGTTKQKRDMVSHNFLENFIPLIRNGHKVQQALSYLVRQTYYYGSLVSMDGMIKICRSFLDYDNLRLASGIAGMDKYPPNIIYSERLLVYNSKSLAEELAEPFKLAVASYKHLAGPISIKVTDGGKKVEKKYVVVCPNTPQDLVAEGSALMHCVGTYGKLVAEGRSKILFLRKADAPTESLITFEFNDKMEVVHAAGAQNAEPNEEETLALKAWSRMAKKGA